MKKSTLSLLIILASVSLAECKEQGVEPTKTDTQKDAVLKTPEKSKASDSKTLKFLASGAVGAVIGALLAILFGKKPTPPLMTMAAQNPVPRNCQRCKAVRVIELNPVETMNDPDTTSTRVGELEGQLNVARQQLEQAKAEAMTELDKAFLQQFYKKILSGRDTTLELVERNGQPWNKEQKMLEYYFYDNNEMKLVRRYEEDSSIIQGDIIKCVYSNPTKEVCYLQVVEIKKTTFKLEANSLEVYSYKFKAIEMKRAADAPPPR